MAASHRMLAMMLARASREDLQGDDSEPPVPVDSRDVDGIRELINGLRSRVARTGASQDSGSPQDDDDMLRGLGTSHGPGRLRRRGECYSTAFLCTDPNLQCVLSSTDAGGASVKMIVEAAHKTHDFDQLDALLTSKEIDINDTPVALGVNLLTFAATAADARFCRWLLDRGADPSRSSRGRPPMYPLHAAALRGSEEIVKLLANSQPPQLPVRSVQDALSLVWACIVWAWLYVFRGCRRSRCRFLDQRGFNGGTPLAVAAAASHGNTVRVLLELGTDTNLRDEQNDTPLHCASQSGNADCARRLLLAGASRDAMGQHMSTPFQFACFAGNMPVVKMYIEEFPGAVPVRSGTGRNGFHQAAQEGHSEVIKLIVAMKLPEPTVDSPDSVGVTPLQLASANGHMAVVELLLSLKANLNYADHLAQRTPLHHAAHNGRDKVVEALCKAGADKDAISRVDETPLVEAASSGHAASVKTLLRFGVRLADMPIKVSHKLIASLADDKCTEVIGVLVDNLWPVDSVDKKGMTTLHHCAENGQAAAAECLTGLGAHPDLRDAQGRTPLQVRRKRVEVSRLRLPMSHLTYGIVVGYRWPWRHRTAEISTGKQTSGS